MWWSMWNYAALHFSEQSLPIHYPTLRIWSKLSLVHILYTLCNLFLLSMIHNICSVISSPCVFVQTQKGSSITDGLADWGDPAEGALRKDPDLPVGPGQCAGAPETAGARQEGADEAPVGVIWKHAGQLMFKSGSSIIISLTVKVHHSVTSLSLILCLLPRQPCGSSVTNSLMLAKLLPTVRWRLWKRSKRRNKLWKMPSRRLRKKQPLPLLPTSSPTNVRRVLARRNDGRWHKLPPSNKSVRTVSLIRML